MYTVGLLRVVLEARRHTTVLISVSLVALKTTVATGASTSLHRCLTWTATDEAGAKLCRSSATDRAPTQAAAAMVAVCRPVRRKRRRCMAKVAVAKGSSTRSQDPVTRYVCSQEGRVCQCSYWILRTSKSVCRTSSCQLFTSSSQLTCRAGKGRPFICHPRRPVALAMLIRPAPARIVLIVDSKALPLVSSCPDMQGCSVLRRAKMSRVLGPTSSWRLVR